MAQASRVQQFKIRGGMVTYLDVRGDYKGIPGDPNSPREGFRLLGVYLNTPKGAYEISLLGPDNAVEFYGDGFERWVRAFK
jgi:hypothetical protein